MYLDIIGILCALETFYLYYLLKEVFLSISEQVDICLYIGF